jgi:hypothetical protein
VDIEMVNTLINSMPQKMQAVIDAQGGIAH